MVDIDLSPLIRFHRNVVGSEAGPKRRYLFDQIDWNEKAIMIIGDRGVGKTTLFTQYAKQKYSDIDQWLYISGDYFGLAEVGLFRAIESYFAQTTGLCVFIDEVHKYPEWKIELKNILDAFKAKQILISGSSSIHLLDGTDQKHSKIKDSTSDLQRRRALYHLQQLSFREYLEFKLDVKLKAWALSDLLSQAHTLTNLVLESLSSKNVSILNMFEDYLAQGCYPYFIEAPSTYAARLENTINTVISSDIALAMDLNMEGVQKLKKLFSLIASSKPMTPNINALARDLGATRETIYKYISYLERAGLIRAVYDTISKASHILTRPNKICLANPNLIQISHEARLHSEYRGALRESFFISNFSKDDIVVAKKGDFQVNGYTFEVGGPSKDASQVKNEPNAFVIRDGQDFPSGKFLPLWIFGFLY